MLAKAGIIALGKNQLSVAVYATKRILHRGCDYSAPECYRLTLRHRKLTPQIGGPAVTGRHAARTSDVSWSAHGRGKVVLNVAGYESSCFRL